jgi:hypothetical protein
MEDGWRALASFISKPRLQPASTTAMYSAVRTAMPTPKSKLRFRIMAGRLPASKIWRGAPASTFHCLEGSG